MNFFYKIVLFFIFSSIKISSHAQNFNPGNIPSDSWAKVLKEKKGSISALWYDIAPFIYRTNKGDGMAGVEYEIMEAFVKHVRKKYQVDLKLEWVDAKSFENIYPYIAATTKPAVFGWSYFSITEERKKQVKFTPAYMPDVNIIVTDIKQPLYASNQAFINSLIGKTAYTMATTMMEVDVMKLKNNFYNGLPVNKEFDDYAVMDKIAQHENSFGYIPLSIYVMALEKGIKIKRQIVLPSRREGFAAIYPKNSDWDGPVNEYFSSPEFVTFSASIIKKYLGNQVTDLIFKASLPDSLRTSQSDNELLTLEKEIVSRNLLASAMDVQEQKVIRNSILAAIVVAFVIMLILYGMFASKQKYAKLLQQRNDIILKQKSEIEIMNRKLEMKVMLAEMNPHLVYNSLNAIQYFITLDDKKNALKYLSNFSKFLRMMMDNASALMVTIDREIKMLNQYLALEKMRFENKFSYQIQPPVNSEDLLIEIPPMLIQPLLESALYKEVLKGNNGSDGYINVEFINGDDFIQVKTVYSSVSKSIKASLTNDSGDELFEESIKKLLERTELINYGKERKVAIEKSIMPDYTIKVIITIPINISNGVH